MPAELLFELFLFLIFSDLPSLAVPLSPVQGQLSFEQQQLSPRLFLRQLSFEPQQLSSQPFSSLVLFLL